MPRRQQHLVVIGDLVDSRSISGKARRSAFQKNLRTLFEAIGHDAGLVSPYTITLGDEFQAVYRHAGGLFRHLFRIRASIMPVRVRFSVALGPLDTAINPEQAIGMDGPAFHLARDAMEELKADPGILRLSAPGDRLPAIAAPLIELLAAETESWNSNRLSIMHGLLAGRTVDDLAGDLAISMSALYKNVRTARLETWNQLLREAECHLSRLLS